MKTRTLTASIVIAATFMMCIQPNLIWADKIEVSKKLAEEVSIQLKDVTIIEALEKIGKKAGIEIVLSDEAQWKLPEGAATRLSVTLVGPLGESLDKMLRVFFMRYVTGEDKLTIYPRPELEHIIGRPNHRQLRLLRTIYTDKFRVTDSFKGTQIEKLGNLKESVLKLLQEKLGDVIFVPSQAVDHIIKSMRTVAAGSTALPVTFADLFEQVSDAWYISGLEFPDQPARINFVTASEFNRKKLDQIIDISFRNEKPTVIFDKLTKYTGIELRYAGDAYDYLFVDGEDCEFSVEMQNIKLRQAFYNLAAMLNVNLDFAETTREGFCCIISPIREDKNKPVGVLPRRIPRKTEDEYIGKISIPMQGGKYYIEFMLRRKDLTEEMQKLWQEKLGEILKPTKQRSTPAPTKK